MENLGLSGHLSQATSFHLKLLLQKNEQQAFSKEIYYLFA